MKDSVKKIFSFEFWQKFGKCLMVVIAVMPAAGLMISIGKTIPMIDPNAAILVTVGGVIEQIGWGVINNLHLLFALAIGGSWAKDRAGGAFAAGLSFIFLNKITGAVYGITTDMITNSHAYVHTIFGTKIAVADYFINVLEAPALNMGSSSASLPDSLVQRLTTSTTTSASFRMLCHSSMVSASFRWWLFSALRSLHCFWQHFGRLFNQVSTVSAHGLPTLRKMHASLHRSFMGHWNVSCFRLACTIC